MGIKRWLNTLRKTPKKFKDPNRHAPKPWLRSTTDSVTIGGYQEFTITSNTIKASAGSYDLARKFELLYPIYNSENLTGKSFLDMGAAGGFFSFLATQNGAIVHAVDLDANYTELILKATLQFKFAQLSVHTQNISEWTEKVDVVNALSLIHWIFSCTSVMGNMDTMIRFFKNITRDFLVIEWIDPQDEAIKYFNHLDYNVNFTDDSYNRKSFITSLESEFDKVESLGYTRKSTRELFIARV